MNNSIDKRTIATYLPTEPIVIEAGAHIGADTKEMAELWAMGTIHSFEPVPQLFTKLEKNTKKYRNVHRYKLALSDNTGQSKLFVSSGKSDGSSSLLAPKEHLQAHPDVMFEKEIVVKTMTMDNWARQYGIKKLDFLWLDMQGYELAVLKAAPLMLNSVSVIYTEVSLIEVYDSVPLYAELRTWLEAQGFNVALEDLRWSDMGNVLFVRKPGDGGGGKIGQ